MDKIDPADLYSQAPPAFGHELKKCFALDPNFIQLNHGSYGTTPYVVQKTANDLSLRIETNPERFIRIEYRKPLNDVCEKLSALVKAQRDEIVLVPNASAGVNTVVRNFEWEKDDIIIFFNTTYRSVYRTAENLKDMSPHPILSEIQLLFPTTPQQIVDLFRTHVKSLPKHEGKKRVAIIDSIISNPGALMPWKELVKICKEEGIWSVIDAAHSIGQEPNINLSDAAPDFWVSNCHKWLHAKRAVAMLYIPERYTPHQKLIKTSFPTSHAYRSPPYERTVKEFLAQWEWNGTVDLVPFLVVGAALEFRKWLGGEEKIFDYCHNLALQGGRLMAEIFGTQVMDPNGEFTLNMVNVELPFPGSIPWSQEIDDLFLRKMLNERNAYSAHFYHNGRWWTRCSAQVYNEIQDFKQLANIWIEVCDEVKREIETDQKN